MKKILLTLTLCGLTFIAKSQNASVEKSMYGIQTGFLGIWVHNESKLSYHIYKSASEIGCTILEEAIEVNTPFILVIDSPNVSGHAISLILTSDHKYHFRDTNNEYYVICDDISEVMNMIEYNKKIYGPKEGDQLCFTLRLIIGLGTTQDLKWLEKHTKFLAIQQRILKMLKKINII